MSPVLTNPYLVIPSAAATFPPVTSGLVMLFDPVGLGLSDGTEITTLTDFTGNGWNGTGQNGTSTTKPTYAANQLDGHGVIQFSNDSSGNYFTLPDLSGTGWTAGHGWVVVKINNDPPAANGRCGPTFGDFGTGGDGYFPFTSGTVFDDFGTDTRKTTVNPATTLAQWNLYEPRSASGAWESFLNGTSIFGPVANTVAWGTGPRIGSSASGAKALNGQIAYQFMYNRILNSTEISDTKTFLSARFPTLSLS